MCVYVCVHTDKLAFSQKSTVEVALRLHQLSVHLQVRPHRGRVMGDGSWPLLN